MIGVLQSPPQQGNNLRLGEWLQHVNAAPGKQGAVDFKRRVLRRCPDEPERAAFHVGQKGVLLRTVETVDFIDEEDGARAHAGGALRIHHHLLDLLDAAGDGGKLDEVGMRGGGNDFGQRGLAGTGRPPEDHGAGLVALNGQAQRLAFSQQMLLPGIVRQRARPHPLGEWRRAGGAGGGLRKVRREEAHNSSVANASRSKRLSRHFYR